ncbi:TRAP transporter small permease [Actibacterium sp. D379-3]
MLLRLYDALITRDFLFIAAATVAFTALATIYDVILRTVGFQPPAATSTLLEYAMLFLAVMAAPVLVRSHSHIVVDALLRALPAGAARALTALVIVLSMCLCATVTYYAAKMGLEALGRGEMDIRAVAIPRWVPFAFLVTGFGFCTLEFARLLILRDFSTLGIAEQDGM